MSQKRIDFYLGNQVLLNNLIIDDINKNKKTINDLTTDPIYDNALKQLLIKTNHQNQPFYIVKGDIEQWLHALTLCKNRCDKNANSVILRCLEFNRHWNNYYHRPDDMPFSAKNNKAFWRGTTTGQPTRKGNRFDLVKKWFDKSEVVRVGFSFISQNKNQYKKYVKGKCDISHFLTFKYIISIEGNDKDSGLNWKLNSNSLVLMPRPRVTSWLMETTLVPNYHYILIKDDFSDLEQKVRWCNQHPQKCKQMVKNANLYMKQFADAAAEEALEAEVIHRYFDILKTVDI